jgi:sugar lactone lactonase YvrE
LKRHAKALVALVIAMLCLSATAAFALQTHKGGSDIDPSPANLGGEVPNYANNGGFGGLSGLAVDQGNGDLYAIDTSGAGAPIEGTGAVHRFDNAGARIDTIDGSATPSGSLSLFDPADVAVDSSGTASDGNFYVTDPGNNLVDAFDASGAPIASFGDSEPPDGQLRGLKTPTGSFSTPCGLAVEPETGNLFVADQNNSKIWIFDSSGAYLERSIADSALQGPCGLAFSSTGEELYVRNSGNGNVLRFHRSGANDYDFAQVVYAQNGGTPENFEDDGPSATDVAVNTADNHLFIDLGERIAEFEPFGGQILTFAQGIASNGIAIDSAGGKIYATDSSTFPPQIRSFSTATITLPDVTTGAATNVTGESATLNGTLDALGIETECEFEYDTDGSYASPTKVPCEPAGPYFGAEAVHADVSGLDPGTTYHYRLHAESAEGENNGADVSFATDGAPIVESLSFSNVTVDGAELRAKVNPAGDATSYRFEYTTEEDFEVNGFANATKAPEPDGSLISANTAQSVTETITGLKAGTRYVFRLLAANGIGTSESPQSPSPPKHFKTLAAPQAPEGGDFPGQGFLPDDRAWELVSPPDKLGADVMPETTHIRAAADGSAIGFGSLAGFSDVRGTGIMTSYLAQRTAAPGGNGWATHAINPPQPPITLLAAASAFAPFYQGEFSDDLSKGVFRAYSPLTDAPNIAGVPGNLFLRDDLRTPGPGSYTLLSDSAVKLTPSTKGTQNAWLAGASEDFQHLIFESGQPLRLLPLRRGAVQVRRWRRPAAPDRRRLRLLGRRLVGRHAQEGIHPADDLQRRLPGRVHLAGPRLPARRPGHPRHRRRCDDPDQHQRGLPAREPRPGPLPNRQQRRGARLLLQRREADRRLDRRRPLYVGAPGRRRDPAGQRRRQRRQLHPQRPPGQPRSEHAAAAFQCQRGPGPGGAGSVGRRRSDHGGN